MSGKTYGGTDGLTDGKPDAYIALAKADATKMKYVNLRIFILELGIIICLFIELCIKGNNCCL